MDFNKLINDNGFYLYKDDSFNTIFIQIGFLREPGNFEDAVYDLLCQYLSRTNKNYKSEYELNKKIIDLYYINYGFNTIDIGSQPLLFFSVDLVSPNVVHDDYSKEAFKFIHEVLLEPDFTREDILENTKRVYLSSLLNSLSQSETMAKHLYERKVINEKNDEYKFSTDEEYITKMINSVTLKDLENIYNKTIRNENFLRGLVFGNIDDKDFLEFRKYIDFKNNKKPLDYSKKYNICEEDIEIPSNTTSESVVYITYSIDDIDEGARKILYSILNGSSDLISEVLREKYGLVYNAYANIYNTGKLLVIKARIDKNNKEQLIKAVDEIIETIQDKNQLKELLKNAKESIKTDYYLLSEDRDMMIDKIDDFIADTYKGFNDNTFIKEIDSIKEEDIIKYTKTLKRKNIFMYRGDANE